MNTLPATPVPTTPILIVTDLALQGQYRRRGIASQSSHAYTRHSHGDASQMGPQRGMRRLGAFLQPAGHNIACWRDPSAQGDAESNFAHYAELARTAERGKFDMLFLADGLGLLAALSVVTSSIGLHSRAVSSE